MPEIKIADTKNALSKAVKPVAKTVKGTSMAAATAAGAFVAGPVKKGATSAAGHVAKFYRAKGPKAIIATAAAATVIGGGIAAATLINKHKNNALEEAFDEVDDLGFMEEEL